MAFRDDEAALHARIESLQNELEEARRRVRELPSVTSERDRLQRRVEELEKQLGIKRAKANAPKPGVDTPSAPGRSRAFVFVLFGVLALGLAIYLALELRGSPLADLGPKPADTRVPTLGVVDLTATPNPVPIPFSVTGTDEAPSGCSGYLPSDPQLVLRTTTPTLVRITTLCNVDLVALLSGMPSGLLCDDDGGSSQQPLLTTTLPAGETRLSIGTYSTGASASCEIEIHATPLAADVDIHGLAATASPTLGTVSLDGAPSANPTFDAHFGPTLIEGHAIQDGCPGVYPSVPDLVLDVDAPSIARIDASAGDTDMVVMMGNGDGTFTCDDDDGLGTNARIAKRVPPGRYPIWVGTYSAQPPGAAYHVGVRLTTIASEVPSSGAPIEVGEGSIEVSGTSGDELSASSMWSDCTVPGFVPYEPNHVLHLAARRDVTLTSARGDLLLVVTPDTRGTTSLRPCTTETEWRGTLDPGTYRVYVGVSSGDTRPGAYGLTIRTESPSVLPYTP